MTWTRRYCLLSKQCLQSQGCSQGSEYEAFASLARDADDVDFFETTSAEAAKAANITARPPSFVMGTAFEGFQPRSTPSVVCQIAALCMTNCGRQRSLCVKSGQTLGKCEAAPRLWCVRLQHLA